VDGGGVTSSGEAAFVPDILTAALSCRPEAAAVRDHCGQWTYADLAAHSAQFARWLIADGVRPADRILVRASADRRFVAMLYGTLLAGATFVPLGSGVTPYQLGHLVRDAEPRLVIAGRDILCHTGGRWGLEPDAVWEGLRAHHGTRLPDRPTGRIAPALLIYTSGSTAMPKAVVCPHPQVLFAAEAIADRVRYRPDDVVFCGLPLSFDYGLYQIFLAGLATAELVLADTRATAGLYGEVRRHGATVVPVVPSHALMLLRLAARDTDPTRIRLFTNTGEAMPRSTVEGLRARFPGAGVQLMFGTTECKRISIMEVDGDKVRPGAVGRALDGTEVRVIDDAGIPVAAGVVGEIVVSGPHVMAGYWRADVLSRRVFRPDPVTGRTWLHTGDYGHLDDDGYLYFAGRRDHVFKRRGVRTSTVEIEVAAAEVDGVLDVAVLPPAGGQDSVLCLVTSNGTTAVDVLDGLRERLESAKVPSRCETFEALPYGPNGKLDRVALAGLVGGRGR
jgi:acyl-CoA synthetase (AMP-forming)/AMP-acid ligase II